jgi:hypothetical protein
LWHFDVTTSFLPPLNNGVSVLRAKEFRANQKVSWCFKRWHRGEIENIVVQQKEGGAVKSKVSWRNKKGQRGETKSIVMNLKESVSVKTKLSW